VTNSKYGFPDEYQDFDIFPDKLKDYDDHTAAVKWLSLVANFGKKLCGESNLQHTRKAAMDLRQYCRIFGLLLKKRIGDQWAIRQS
jgi:hypothetical protein